MSQPGVGDVHINRLLSNVSEAYKNTTYIVSAVVPPLFVAKQSDLIATYPKSFWARSVAKKTNPMEPAPIGGYEVAYKPYFCEERSVGDVLPDALFANEDPPFDARADSSEWVADQLELEQEISFLTDYWKPGVWGADKTGGSDFVKWSDYALSNPLQDMEMWARDVKIKLLGRKPNTAIFGDLTFALLKNHPQLLERVKYSGSQAAPAMVTKNLIAQLLELDRVEVGEVVYTTTPEGTGEDDVVYQAGYDDDAWLGYIAPRPGRKTPTALTVIYWQTLYGGRRFIRQRREPLSDKGWLIEGFTHYQIYGMSVDAGLFISDAVDESTP